MDKQEQPINVKDLFSIQGKVALVTGGSRGIGMMIARGYLEAGAKVYISSRKKDACEQAAAKLSEIGPCYSIPADLSTNEGCRHLADELSAREQSLDILVNNAGAAWGAPLEEYPEAGFDKVMDTNVKGVFFLTQHLLPLLERAARPGDPKGLFRGTFDLLPPRSDSGLGIAACDLVCLLPDPPVDDSVLRRDPATPLG